MIFQDKTCTFGGKTLLLRSPRPEDAQLLVDYLKTVSGETRFLRCEPDELHFTPESEAAFIESTNDSASGMMILAFMDGEYIGNCSFTGAGASRRNNHRATVGIALFQKYTGQGLGRLMLSVLLEEMRKRGFEQAELTVVSENRRAQRLYEALGFTVCGRLPHANKYDDGSYSDDIYMVKQL